MRQPLNHVTARWMRSRRQGVPYCGTSSSPELFHMQTEGRLLVLCARTSINSFVRVEIEDLVGDVVDWEVVWRLAKDQEVASLVYRALSAICPAAVPAAIHEAFRRHLRLNAFLNTVLAKELVTILDALTAKGVRAIPFRGPTLAQTAYGDLGLHEFEAIDLIVDRGSILQARQVLWSQGYQFSSPDNTDAKEPEVPYHFSRKKNGIMAVNLQWAITRRYFTFRLDRSECWDRAKSVHLSAHNVKGLSPEDLLIVLCLYGSQQAWVKLKWICDVAELVRRRPALDWSRVWFQADEWGCRRIVLLGLAMARNLFDTRLPRAVLHQLDVDAEMSDLMHRMPKQLLKHPGHGIDKECVDALYLTLKDTRWERWKLGMAFCRDEARIITQPLPWFREQGRLRRWCACLKALRWCIVRCVPSIGFRQAVVRWVRSSG